MTSKRKATTASKPAKAERRHFPARVKCEAILSVWSERRKPSEICKDLGVNWATLNQWQNRALSAMMKELEPKVVGNQDRGPALGEKLEKLLEQTSQRVGKFAKLEKRLEKIQSQSTTK